MVYNALKIRITAAFLNNLSIFLPKSFYGEESPDKHSFDFQAYRYLCELYRDILISLETKEDAYIQELQIRRLRKVLSEAQKTTWWKDYFTQHAVQVKHIQSLQDLVNIPPVTRFDLIDVERKDLMTIPENDKRVIWRSSGGSTTGTPFWWGLNKTILTVNVLAHFMQELAKRDYPGDFSKNCYIEFNYPHTTERSEFRWFSHGDFRIQSADPVFSQKIHAMMNVVERIAPCIIRTTPTELLILAKEYKAQNMQTPIACISLTGQVLDDDVRTFAQEQLKSDILVHYGAQEIGPLSFECPDHHGQYHLFRERVIVEILDELGQPCQGEEVGNVTITSLDNTCMPLIRYQLGDMGLLHIKACSCGNNNPRLELARRATDIIVLSDGRNEPVSNILRRFNKEPFLSKIRRFQVRQEKVDTITIALEIKEHLDEHTLHVLTKSIQEKYGKALNIIIEEVDEIQTQGKFKVFIPLSYYTQKAN